MAKLNVVVSKSVSKTEKIRLLLGLLITVVTLKALETTGFWLEPPTGFEPVTPCLQDRCSGQLS